jgi:ribosomal protein L13E
VEEVVDEGEGEGEVEAEADAAPATLACPVEVVANVLRLPRSGTVRREEVAAGVDRHLGEVEIVGLREEDAVREGIRAVDTSRRPVMMRGKRGRRELAGVGEVDDDEWVGDAVVCCPSELMRDRRMWNL